MINNWPITLLEDTVLREEQTLVEQAKHDPQAFAILYDRYLSRIYTYAYRQLQNESLAQDITAITFEKALHNIQKYQWQGKVFGAWLYRIARNEIIQHHRRQRFVAPWQQWLGAKTDERHTEDTVQRDEQSSELHKALNQLSTKDRELISLRYFEELTNEEIAHILGTKPANVYVRLHRALKRLQQRLETTHVLSEIRQ